MIAMSKTLHSQYLCMFAGHILPLYRSIYIVTISSFWYNYVVKMAASFLRASDMSIPHIKHYFNLCLGGNATIEECYQILLFLKCYFLCKHDTSLSSHTSIFWLISMIESSKGKLNPWQPFWQGSPNNFLLHP